MQCQVEKCQDRLVDLFSIDLHRLRENGIVTSYIANIAYVANNCYTDA